MTKQDELKIMENDILCTQLRAAQDLLHRCGELFGEMLYSEQDEDHSEKLQEIMNDINAYFIQ